VRVDPVVALRVSSARDCAPQFTQRAIECLDKEISVGRAVNGIGGRIFTTL